MTQDPRPFHTLGLALRTQGHPLREAITLATRRDEPACVQALLEDGSLGPQEAESARSLALHLSIQLRQRKVEGGRGGLVQALMQEFSLSSQEGVALMCLAEALLRIPDLATRDALIRDKIAGNNWTAHLGHSPSLFVNATAWGLMLTGKLVGTHGEAGLRAALKRAAIKGGEPVIRKSVDVAMRMLGEQFVLGETIQQALHKARQQETQGYRHSYDMLGEAALTEEDAQRYLQAYEDAIHAIALKTQGRSLYQAPGISIKLSALHPRYTRHQYTRVMDELYPRLLRLCTLVRDYNIGLNIDAEESERLELSLDLMERLCHEPAMHGWDGIGFVVQAYQKRAPFVLDYLIDLARRSHHRLMVRLVKGAYWDSEIKRAQIEGQRDYPVYTRKTHTDLAYLACARKLLSAPADVYPQFATHNAHTLASIIELAGPDFLEGQYEFQCLHGMGEPLYDMVIKPADQGGLGRPCRIYAPVGTHETLLAYLVRRLLENGANSSFVNKVADEDIDLDDLIMAPGTAVLSAADTDGVIGASHPDIPLPDALYGDARPNSIAPDLYNDIVLTQLQADLSREALPHIACGPIVAHALAPSPELDQTVRNPADRRDTIGTVRWVGIEDVNQACETAANFAAEWQHTPASRRAAMLDTAADLMCHRGPMLLNLLVREAGKTLPNAIGEVREAIDFLRYNAAQIRSDLHDGHHQALGPVACISPWNFPLAIFTGQVAAALAAGNTVLAKPAEQTPLIAAQAVRLLHEAGIPRAALQMLPGDGETTGAALVAHAAIRGVMFTGSTQVARHIQAQLASRLNERKQPVALVAETGGQNAMIVDSSALAEQVVQDVLTSAFDSAGQRCSALRVLCLQEEVADRVLHMLKGAMCELRLGPTDRLQTDVGPLIDQDALEAIELHIATLRACDRPVYQAETTVEAAQAHGHGCFIPPTLIELTSLDELVQEVFGPVLHILRFKRDDLGELVTKLNDKGYGLTMGIHSRINETIDFITERAHIGNIYVNRNMIGAVVGVQPFGGEGLSGTGPKAGGPLYLHRLLHHDPDTCLRASSLMAMAGQDQSAQAMAPLHVLADWLATSPVPHAQVLLEHARHLLTVSPIGLSTELPGPTGERNGYRLRSKDAVLCLASDLSDLLYQLCTVLAAGTQAVWLDHPSLAPLLKQLPDSVRERIHLVRDMADAPWQAVLMHAEPVDVIEMAEYLSEKPGPILSMQTLAPGWHQPGGFSVWRLFSEQSVSVNTTAAGGNARLMSLT
ncbi:MAG: trifunctional transcriptional regulator/proline dehydrogenase/L-glutamate gamma-semialdehyde dehydrogenase [Aquabacterium sp.]|uniref:trifunctional transcriptional regulator/proline dehydrogenase/L-glutamate gamma-semialdehyde dehydrogenase n=1 Tax=Aquabacterium sp. TaxID=1872578 RepID=UPI00122229BF|nr:trifunctional transcriptional regulator/proline dehydrogenase/L-glutamate gamma-semialdehyde dehydrogenase [Aquabacterium sp.]TAK93915.1 MAG: trifunctional transcriptional regulator/proline dehydrogenase/L-glutamate gamma-semialdehyde dehydrogenase [Aquabacterium sp.]